MRIYVNLEAERGFKEVVLRKGKLLTSPIREYLIEIENEDEAILIYGLIPEALKRGFDVYATKFKADRIGKIDGEIIKTSRPCLIIRSSQAKALELDQFIKKLLEKVKG